MFFSSHFKRSTLVVCYIPLLVVLPLSKYPLLADFESLCFLDLPKNELWTFFGAQNQSACIISALNCFFVALILQHVFFG